MSQINVIVGDTSSFDSVLYPMQHQANQSFIQHQLSNFSSTLTDIGREFMHSARALHDELNSSAAAMLARNALRAAKGMFINQIVEINDLVGMQTASSMMQRWIMTNPVVRAQYHAQRCDGFSDTYIDMHPGVVGENHYDYRRVMDAVIVDDANGSYARYYLDDLLEGDRELNHGEKMDILNTWSVLEIMMAKHIDDPTSPYGGKL